MKTALLLVLLCWPILAAAENPDPFLVGQVLAQGRVKDPAYVESVVLAAQSAATQDFPVELLLGLADVESDFESRSVSRLIGSARQTGTWRSSKAPKGSHGNYFCGITQAIAPTWKRCMELRDPAVAMTAGVAELQAWLKRGKSVRIALQGHGCGNAGMTGACASYATRVLRRARLFIIPAPGPRPKRKPSS